MHDAGERSRPADITVVIPAYRAEATVRRAIDSVLAQPDVSCRIVIVVDGRFDRTTEVIADYPSDRVLVLEHETNKGATVSRNDGLAQADTEYVMFLDADDFLEGPLLSGLRERMAVSDADVGFGPMQVLHEADLGDGPLSDRLVATARRAITGKRPVPARNVRGPVRVPDYASPEDVFRKWHLEGIFVAPCAVLWRTAFIRSIGGWDPELTRNDDGELVMRAILKGAKFTISDQGQAVYVKHSSDSLSQRVDNLESMIWANERLLAIDSPAISRKLQKRICAGHYFNIAWQGYAGGREDVAAIALQRSRAMGFGTRGRVPHRIAFRLLGLKHTVRLLVWLRRATRPAPTSASVT